MGLRGVFVVEHRGGDVDGRGSVSLYERGMRSRHGEVKCIIAGISANYDWVRRPN